THDGSGAVGMVNEVPLSVGCHLALLVVTLASVASRRTSELVAFGTLFHCNVGVVEATVAPSEGVRSVGGVVGGSSPVSCCTVTVMGTEVVEAPSLSVARAVSA